MMAQETRPLLMCKASKSMVLVELLCRACCKVSPKISQAGFKKRSTFNLLDSTDDNIVCGAKGACQASNADDFSGISDVDAACDIDYSKI